MDEQHSRHPSTAVRVVLVLTAGVSAFLEWWWLPTALAISKGNRTFAESTGFGLFITGFVPLFVVTLALRWAGISQAGTAVLRYAIAVIGAAIVCGIPAMFVAMGR